MRLAGFVLIVLVLGVLTKFAYDQRARYVPGMVASVTGGPLVHDLRFGGSIDGEDPLLGRGARIEVSYSELEPWVGMSGLDAFGHVAFPLPRSIGIKAGELELNLSSELEEGAVVRLRFNVNGSKRGEIVLEAGVDEHKVLLPLGAEDLLTDRLVLTMATDGVHPHVASCAHWDGGIVVRLRPSSRLRLTTDESFSDAQDRLTVSGPQAHVHWPEAATASHKAALLRMAVVRGGVAFVSGIPDGVGLSLSEEEASAVADALWTPAVVSEDWPVPVDRLASNTTLRDLQRSTTWRINYDRRLLPDGAMPRSLTLGLRAAAMGEDTWQLIVSQDGRLIHSETLTGEELDITRQLALRSPDEGQPATDVQFAGTLEVTLRRRARSSDGSYLGDDAHCGEPTPAVGELTELSVLNSDGEASFLDELVARLQEPVALETTDDLSARDAEVGVAALRTLFPDGSARFVRAGEEAVPRFTVLPPDRLGEQIAALERAHPATRRWLFRLTADETGHPKPDFLRLNGADAAEAISVDRAAILISLP